MFWVIYMMFSLFRSHRDRIYWHDGQFHIVKENPVRRRERRAPLTSAQEQESFRRDIRQWLIFYSILACIILALLIHRLNSNRQLPK